MFSKKSFSLAIVLIIFPLLTACTGWNLDRLETTTLQGTKFQNFLAKEYQDFSRSEADQYDWGDSSYFARKGLAAAYGNDVEPEFPEERGISRSMLPSLKDAREQLLTISSAENKEKHPENIAKIQVLYDCWVEQLEENWQTEHIASCRDEFFDALNIFKNKLKEQAKPAIVKKEPPAIPAKPKFLEKLEQEVNEVKENFTVKFTKPKAKTTTRVVHFSFDSANLNTKAREIVKEIARIKEEYKGAEIDVIASGHADRAGSESYNLKLSKKRAEIVKRELVNKGFDAEQVTIYAYGELSPAVDTKDGVAEPENRRVEILIKY